jgi:phosphoglucomutase
MSAGTRRAPGQLPDAADLVDVGRLIAGYYEQRPDPSVPEQRVAFGTSGHRGASLHRSFNEHHVVAISEAICRYRAARAITGPLFLGRDTHALSEPAFRTALEVLAARGVDVVVDVDHGYTPTPVISHQILTHNKGRSERLADGIVLTPSHNPPEDGGFKYNPPHGGPAGTDATAWIQEEANALLEAGLEGIRRVPFEQASRADTTHGHDYVSAYVGELGAVIDVDAIRSAGLRLGVDPLGGASLAFWDAIADRHRRLRGVPVRRGPEVAGCRGCG